MSPNPAQPFMIGDPLPLNGNANLVASSNTFTGYVNVGSPGHVFCHICGQEVPQQNAINVGGNPNPWQSGVTWTAPNTGTYTINGVQGWSVPERWICKPCQDDLINAMRAKIPMPFGTEPATEQPLDKEALDALRKDLEDLEAELR